MSGVVLLAALVIFFAFFFSRRPSEEQDATPQPTASARSPASSAPSASQEPEVFGARHVLVQYTGARRASPELKRTKEQAQKRATEVATKAAALAREHKDLDELAKAFGELVKEYSDEPGAAERGGELGRFRRDGIDPQFGAAVSKLAKGTVSGAVETPFGFHVILRTF